MRITFKNFLNICWYGYIWWWPIDVHSRRNEYYYEDKKNLVLDKDESCSVLNKSALSDGNWSDADFKKQA